MEDKLVYDGWLKIYNREIDGKKYDILINYDAVSAIILNEFNEILLVKQFRPALMRETLEIPAGSLDIEGESLEECLIRELEEETNLSVEKEELEKVIEYKPIMGFSDSTMNIFKIEINKEKLKDKYIKDADVTEVIWMKLKEFEENINKGIINDSKTLISYYYLKSNNYLGY